MSLILDALRKSERSRQHSLSAQVGTVDTPPARTHLPVPWSTLIGLLLAVNAVVLAVVYWRGSAPPPAAAAPAYRPEVRPLAEEAAQAGAETPAPPAAAAGNAGPPAVNPAPPAPLPTAENLATQIPASLPALHLDVHGYASKPSERFVVINLHRYQVGDTLVEGPKVIDIVPQGVVLEYQGSTFLLPRP